MNSKIRYVDAQKMHRQHPQTFDAPSGEMLSALKPGDWVKVCAYSERFWVEVKEINGEEVKGRIDNMLITRKLAYNQVISFAKKHIYDILTQEKHAETKQHQATKRQAVVEKRAIHLLNKPKHHETNHETDYTCRSDGHCSAFLLPEETKSVQQG